MGVVGHGDSRSPLRDVTAFALSIRMLAQPNVSFARSRWSEGSTLLSAPAAFILFGASFAALQTTTEEATTFPVIFLVSRPAALPGWSVVNRDHSAVGVGVFMVGAAFWLRHDPVFNHYSQWKP